MQTYLKNKNTLEKCHIYRMLRENANRDHISFHTPGHKVGAWDLTELSFSDNLSSPNGCILQAEKEIAEILGSYKSFILTDGSTSGVLSMLYAVKELGAKTVAFSEGSHKSVYNGCKLLGLTPLLYPTKMRGNIPYKAPMYEMTKEFAPIFEGADVIFLTSPDYYGNVEDLQGWRSYCDQRGKFLLIDGAHGGHLHFHKELYAGEVADVWVDGVHKSLPAFTQGAVVSARTQTLAEKLREGVDIFRTTSPSYPIMASVEYAVKFPQNERLERYAKETLSHPRVCFFDDWTKVCVLVGKYAFQMEKELEKQGVFAEFCDGNVLMFYLSPATSFEEIDGLKNRLFPLLNAYPYEEENKAQRIHTTLLLQKQAETEWVELENAVGCVCALNCGLFPPCTPLIWQGERIEKDQILLLQKANNVFGLKEKKILIYKRREEIK